MSEINILIVEDEAIVAEDIASRLEKMNYAVVDIVASGEEAIAAAKTTQPDLVLMDIMLQGDLDGIAAAETIYTNLNIPIIYLTAYADRSTLQRAKGTHPFAYILKPFKNQDLQAAIEVARSRHQKEEQIEQTLQTLERQKTIAETRNQEKSDYLSLLSHDLRNSISNIIAWVQLFNCASDDWNRETKNQALLEIEKAGERMIVVLDNVLKLSQREQLEATFSPIKLDVVGLCKTLIDKIQYDRGNKYKVKLVCQGQKIESAFIDEKFLWHLLNNLLSNAINYSAEGSEVSLTLMGLENEICFKIKDGGIGIPKKDLPHLFESFKRGSNVGLIPGNGLGLAIAKRIVELHRGTIEIHSEEHQGTTVVVRLPVKP